LTDTGKNIYVLSRGKIYFQRLQLAAIKGKKSIFKELSTGNGTLQAVTQKIDSRLNPTLWSFIKHIH